MQEKRTLTGTHGTHNTMHFADQRSPYPGGWTRRSMEPTIHLQDNSGEKTDFPNFYATPRKSGGEMSNQSNRKNCSKQVEGV